MSPCKKLLLQESRPLRVGYADPPYIGMSAKFYKDHPDYAGEVDHQELVDRLMSDYDCWALHLHSGGLREILPMCPPDVRVMSWVKPFAVFKKGVNPVYAWEPVIIHGGRKMNLDEHDAVFDWSKVAITMKRGLTGAKPEGVVHWVCRALGLNPGDEFHDMYPGSGAVQRAWETFCSAPQLRISSSPSRQKPDPLENFDVPA